MGLKVGLSLAILYTVPKKKTNDDKEKKISSYTLELDDPQMRKISDYCDYHLWEAFSPDYSRFAFRNKNKKVTVVGYNSGKLVVSGKGTEEFVRDFIEAEVTGDPRLGYDEVPHPEWFEHHAGLDEAGKGDLFGPLVVATVIAQGDQVHEWLKEGLKDSKALTDSTILRLDKMVRKTKGVTVQTAYSGMQRYNELMAKPQANLNKYLAWLHAKALQKALEKDEPPYGLLDQFSKSPLTQQQLKKDGVDFDLRMQTKAESDPVVAAASVVARAEFVRQMQKLSDAYGDTLPKGSGAHAKKAAQQLVNKLGPDQLGTFAKLHFKTAYEVLGLPTPVKTYNNWK